MAMGSAGAGGSAGAAAADGGAADGGAVGTCGLTSPAVQVEGRPTCTGRLAASYLSNALCSCNNVQVLVGLTTRGFDSRQGPFRDLQPGEGGAAVGVNGTYLTMGPATIGGSLSIAGPPDLDFKGTLGVAGDFWAAGNVVTVGAATVARDAWLAGSYLGLGPLTVARALHHGLGVVATPTKAGSDVMGPVTVPKPCPCAAGEVLDISALVANARADNDDADYELSPDAFATVSGPSSWTIPCGRMYLTQIGGIGSLHVHVTGMSAVFVDGSIALTGDLVFDVDPGAQVDVFVRDGFKVTGRVALASKERPSAGRLWVGGSQAIALPSPWVGNLYAPHAATGARLGLEVWGSIFSADFSADATASFIFDRSILDAGATCGAPQPTAGQCQRCGTCSGGTACMSSGCASCLADSDCCSLDICANGSCVPWLNVQL